MKKSTSPRILLYDCETSFNVAAVFQLKQYDGYIPHGNILSERHLISICWMWLGESKVHSVSLLDDPKRFAKDIHDDYHVVKTFCEVLETADCAVAHNGDKFDFKYIATRALINNLGAMPPIASIDTYKIAKQRFMFNANRLDYLGKLLGLGGKKSTPSGLWLDVLKGSKKAIKTMVEYNKRDVTLLRDVFLKLRPYMSAHVNRQLFGQKEGCPRCGSHKVQSRGVHRAISRVYNRWQCQACTGWFKTTKAEKAPTTSTRML